MMYQETNMEVVEFMDPSYWALFGDSYRVVHGKMPDPEVWNEDMISEWFDLRSLVLPDGTIRVLLGKPN